MGFSFVTVVRSVFEKSYHVKNGKALKRRSEYAKHPLRVAIIGTAKRLDYLDGPLSKPCQTKLNRFLPGVAMQIQWNAWQNLGVPG